MEVDVETFLKERQPILTPKQVGEAVLSIATGSVPERKAAMLTADGLKPIP
jgi:hypothetical protein